MFGTSRAVFLAMSPSLAAAFLRLKHIRSDAQASRNSLPLCPIC